MTAATAAQAALLPAALRALPAPVAVADADGRVLAANPAWEREVGAGRPSDGRWAFDSAPHPDAPGLSLVAARPGDGAEARLRAALEAGRVFAFEWDAATDRLTRTANAAAILGCPPGAAAETTGRDRLSRVHPDDRAGVEAALARLAPGAARLALRYRYLRPDGRAVTLDETAAARFDVDGALLGVSGLARDVTEQAESAARAAAALGELQAIYDSAPVGLCVLDADLRWTRINARLAEINGLPVEAHLGRAVREVLPSVADAAEGPLRRVLETGEPALGVEVRGETPAQPGVERVWEEDWLPLRDPATGRVSGVSIVAREVTEERALRARLAESERRFRRLADAVPSMLFEVEPGRERVWGARSWSDFTGLPPEALAGRGWRDVVHPDDLPGAQAEWRAAAAEEEPARDFVHRQRLRRADGAWRWHIVRARAERGEDGRARRWFGAATDIHDLVEAEARLRLAQEAGGIGVFERDLRTGVAHWSPELRRLYGFGTDGPDLPMGEQAFLELIHPEDRAAHRARRDAVRNDPSAARYAYQFRIRRGDTGEERWISSRGEIERDAAGKPVLVRGVQQDITEVKRAEAALSAEAARAGLALRAGGLVAWELDAATGEVFADGGLAALFGAGPGEADGTMAPFVARIHPEDRARVQREFQAATAPGGAYRSEFRVLPRAGGGERWLLGVGEGVAGPGGTVRVVGYNADITARREAERDALLLRVFADRANDLLSLIDVATGRYVFVNAAYARAVGRAPEELRALSVRDLDATFDGARFARLVARLAAGETVPPFDAALRRADGSVFPVEISSTLLEHDGRPLLGSVLRDVSERREAERLRAESEARLRVALEAAGMGAWEWDARTEAIAWDAAMRRLTRLDLPTGEGAGHAFRARVHPDDVARVEGGLAAAVAAGPGGEFREEFRFLRGDGAWRWLVGQGLVVAGEPLRMVGVNADITEQREAEAALAASEARFRAMVDAMPQIAFTALPDGFNDFANARWRDYTGVGPGRGLGHDWAEAVHPDDRPETLARWRAALASGEPYEREHRLRGADGAHRPFLTRAVPLRGEGGAILRWFGTSTDISDIVAAREAASRSAEELERLVAERTRALTEASRELQAEMRRREEAQDALLQAQKMEALGQLTGGVAHDFNNLLAVVQGAFRLLEPRVAGDARGAAVVAHGLEATERGARLVAQLMSFARRERLRPAELDPAAVLRRAEEMVAQVAGQGARLRFDVSHEAWPVIADAVRLETALLNLAANARDAVAAAGGGPGEIAVSLRNARPEDAPLPGGLDPARDWVRLAVEDTGCGMDAETLRRATEPFFTTKPAGQGTGLGLASVHGFAAQSGGAIRLSSEPGKGTRVEVFLPRAGLTGTAPGPGATPVAAAAAPGRVLLVDDDSGVRFVTAEALRALGHEVLEAGNAAAAEALAHAEGLGAVGVLVTDVAMPGASGPELAARLRAERPDLPVLYLTGHAGEAELGDAPVLRKPFTAEDLAREIARALGRAPPTAPPTAAPQPSDRLLARLRAPALREVYLRWLALRAAGEGAGLPKPSAMPPEALPGNAGPSSFLAEPDGAGGFRYLRVGARLAAAAEGRALEGEAAPGPVDELARSLGAAAQSAYARCLSAGAPFYDYARIPPGEGGGGVLFERLLLPLSEGGGAAGATHVLGTALFTALPEPPKP